MWVLTPIGFFSIVEKEDGDQLTVRARTWRDIAAFRNRIASRPDIVAHAGTDYPFRLVADRDEVKAVLNGMVDTLDYPNFKDAVHERQGDRRAAIYMKVWSALRELEEE